MIASGRVGLDLSKEIFIVSRNPLREFTKSLMDGKAPKSTEGLIDEQSLVTNILLAAQKGCCPSEYGVGWARKSWTMRGGGVRVFFGSLVILIATYIFLVRAIS